MILKQWAGHQRVPSKECEDHPQCVRHGSCKPVQTCPSHPFAFHHPPHTLAELASQSTRTRYHWSKALDRATLELARTRECFQLIEGEPCLEYCLPTRPNMTAGAKLKHCYQILDGILERFKPCIYKIGYTHCAYFRFFNQLFGYAHEKDKWEKMLVVYASSEAISPSFVEGAMIQRHKGSSSGHLTCFFCTGILLVFVKPCFCCEWF